MASGFTCPECGQPAGANGWCTNSSCSSANIAPEPKPPPDEPTRVPDSWGDTGKGPAGPGRTQSS